MKIGVLNFQGTETSKGLKSLVDLKKKNVYFSFVALLHYCCFVLVSLELSSNCRALYRTGMVLEARAEAHLAFVFVRRAAGPLYDRYSTLRSLLKIIDII